MGAFEQTRGYVWNQAEQKYELASQPVTTEPNGDRRDYGVWYNAEGIGYRCGWPGERIARSRPPRDWAEEMAKHSAYSEADLRDLYNGRTLFD